MKKNVTMKKDITWTFPNRTSDVIGTIEQIQFLGEYIIKINKGFLDNYKYPTLRFLAYICGHSDRLYIYKNNNIANKILLYDAFTGKQPLAFHYQNSKIDGVLYKHTELIMNGYDNRVLLQPRITNILTMPISMGYISSHDHNDNNDCITVNNQELYKLENFSRQWFINPIVQYPIGIIQD